MIKKNCVFIIGAGASQVYKFPSGGELRDRVIELLGTQPNLDTLFSDYDPKLVSTFRESLLKSGKQSVDAFLENRSDLIDIGKYAISCILTVSENIKNLHSEIKTLGATTLVSYHIQRDWLEYLFQLMDSSFEKFCENDVQFITFNYDRSFETFLFDALKYSFNKSDDEVAEILNKIKIIHVHGQLGLLPWQKLRNELTREYKSDWRDIEERKRDIRVGAAGIKIIHEANKNSPEFIEARTFLNSAKSILFLGFGYAKRNIERLEIRSNNKNIWGTIYGLSRAEVDEVKLKYFQGNFNCLDNTVDCLDFLREMSRNTFRE